MSTLVVTFGESMLRLVPPGLERLLQRSEEHTSELQSHLNLVCRLPLEKKRGRSELPRSVRVLQLILYAIPPRPLSRSTPPPRTSPAHAHPQRPPSPHPPPPYTAPYGCP